MKFIQKRLYYSDGVFASYIDGNRTIITHMNASITNDNRYYSTIRSVRISFINDIIHSYGYLSSREVIN